ncbi:MAG: hypothetical protein P1P64_02420, partial [Treponemataceae bacterium]
FVLRYYIFGSSVSSSCFVLIYYIDFGGSGEPPFFSQHGQYILQLTIFLKKSIAFYNFLPEILTRIRLEFIF